MLVIHADTIAGSSIEEAISDALEISEKLNCMVSMELNDVQMVFLDSQIFGETREDRIRHYAEEFRHRNASNSDPKESSEEDCGSHGIIRNCDVGNPEEQTFRYNRYCSRHRNRNKLDPCSDCPLVKVNVSCVISWMNLPYEKEDK